LLTALSGTAGRKEIVMFFYMYALIEALAIFLDSGIIPTANAVYPVCRRSSTVGHHHPGLLPYTFPLIQMRD
jgi:hypothetical protein